MLDASGTVAISSTPPEAPSRWPIMLLVLLMASLRAWSPKTFLMALVSAASPSSVLVPWALTYCTSSGLSVASLQGELHGLGGAGALGMRGGDVVGVGGAAARRAARRRSWRRACWACSQFFEDEDAGALR